jgi:hypothetical protein
LGTDTHSIAPSFLVADTRLTLWLLDSVSTRLWLWSHTALLRKTASLCNIRSYCVISSVEERLSQCNFLKMLHVKADGSLEPYKMYLLLLLLLILSSKKTIILEVIGKNSSYLPSIAEILIQILTHVFTLSKPTIITMKV